MKRKVLAYILAAAVTVTGIVQTDATAFAHNTTDAATERSGESTEDVIDVTDAVKAEALGSEGYKQITEETSTYVFGTDVTEGSAYSEAAGKGFSRVEFPNEAAGWDGGSSGKGVYHPRQEVRTEGDTVYVAAADGALAISSRVWTEKESTGYGVYTYEETNTFDLDCASADYEITVEFVNPTSAAYTAYVSAEDIARGYDFKNDGKDNMAPVTDVTVAAGETKAITVNACVYDGQLNLKFLGASSATSRAAAIRQTVYVSKVTVKRKATEEAGTKPTIFLVSDSTVQSYTDYYAPQTGWGEVLCEYFGVSDYKAAAKHADNSVRHESMIYEADDVIVENRALGGRSSASFIQEGLLDDVLEDVKPGDYMFIQFGHNDNTPSRPNRYVAPADFGKWMQTYVNGAIQRGVTPVLVTPVARYDYSTNSDGSLKTFNSGFAKYGAVMKDISEKQNIPLIDLTARSIAVCNKYGIADSKKLFLHVAAGQYTGQYANGATDNTHLQVLGAKEFSKCVAQGLKASKHPALAAIAQYVNVEMPPEAPKNVRFVTPAEGTALQRSVTIEWDASEGATSYIVYRRSVKGEYLKIAEVTGTSYTDENDVATNIHNYYTVAASNTVGVGEQSDVCETPIIGSMTLANMEKYSDRALTGIDLAGGKGAGTLVSATDADGNEYTSGVYLSWRSFASDFDDNDNLTTTFDVFKGETKIASNIKVTNLIDPAGTASDTYKVVGSNDATIGVTAKAIKPWDKQYLEFSLYAPADETMPDKSKCDYSANDMSVGDVDGDGVLELIVKWYPSNAQDNSKGGYTGKTFLDTYKLDCSAGTASLMTRIDMGVNIRSGAHYTQFQVWDFDGDGKAELAVKTADGTTTYKSKDGTDNNLEKVAHVGAVDAAALPVETQQSAANHDYRSSSGYVLDGPEYFSFFNLDDGTKAGEEVEYAPVRGTVGNWGDTYGNRVDRFLSAVAYLDGENPYAVFCRGYYTRTTLTAYYYDQASSTIKTLWKFDTDKDGTNYCSQGNHGLSVNDVDGDGKDEIIYGSLTIDHNGQALYSTGLGHGDAMHVSDWMPWRDGLEIMNVHEEGNAKYKAEIHDAATGEMLMGYWIKEDTGRGAAADIDPTAPGAEWWTIAKPGFNGKPAWDSLDGAVMSTTSTLEDIVMLADVNPPANFTLFWDGDLLSEIQDHKFNESNGYVPIGSNILKWDYANSKTEELLYSEEIWSNNGTKGNMGLVADILGDWREEIITRTTDAKSADGSYVDGNNKIRVYMTTIQTDYVVPCLLENLAYREGIAWQNVGYNQPANVDYLLSEDVITAQLTAVDSDAKETKIGFTAANDGKYGHKIVGYNVYRADVDAEGKAGAYTQLTTLVVPTAADAGAEYDYVYTDTEVEFNKTYSYKIAAVVEAQGVVAGEGGTAGQTVTRDSYMSRAVEADTPVDIASVEPITLEDVVQGTPCESVADLLPKTVKVTDKAGAAVDAKVTWDVSAVKLAEVGTYDVKAKVKGYAQEIATTLKVVANVMTDQSIKEFNIVKDKTDLYEVLPNTMTLTFLNGVQAEVAVTWDKASVEAIDTSVVDATYVVTGTWKNNEVIADDKSVQITVKIVTNYIVSVDPINVDVAIGAGDILSMLPGKVMATYENGEKQQVDIVWSQEDLAKVDTTKPGTYEIGFTTEQYNGVLKATVNVLYPDMYKFDFGIDSNLKDKGWTDVTVNQKKGTKTVEQLGLTYSDEKGYGFLDGSKVIEGRTETGYTQDGIYSKNVYQDFVLGQPGIEFAVKVPNGKYQVLLMSGSQDKSRNVVAGTFEKDTDNAVAVNFSSDSKTYVVATFEVVVEDGRLDFAWTGSNARTNMMIVRRMASMSLSEQSAKLELGETLGLSVTYFHDEYDPEATADGAVWTSNNKDVATVDANGVVTAVASGTAVITATKNGVSASCTVKVGSDDTEGSENTGDSQPGNSEGTGDSQPGSSEGTGDSQGNSEATGDSQPGNSETGSSQPGNSETGSSQPGNSETGSSQPGNSETGSSQPGNSETGNSQAPGANLTEQQKKQVATLTKKLGVSEETAIKIQALGEQYNVPQETLLINDKTITGQKSDADIKGSSFALLQARAAKTTTNQITLKWTKVKGADGYLIYGNKCGKSNKYKLIKTIKKGGTTSFTQKKLKKGTFYKYIVRAYKEVDGHKVTLAASKTIHFVTNGGKNGNEKAVKVNKTKVNLKRGKSVTIKGTAVKGSKKLVSHRKVAYESTNPKVAKVTSAGKITAVKKGKCTIYVYSQSGLFKKVTVTVS